MIETVCKTMNVGYLLYKNSNNGVSSEIPFEEETKGFPRGINCELRFLLSMLNSKIAKDAFQPQAETSQKELKQHLETSQEGLREKQKRRGENNSVYQGQMPGFIRKTNNNVPTIQL